MKRTAVILLAFCIVLLFPGCTEKHNEKLPAASVKYLIKPAAASEETDIDDVIAAFSALCRSKECSDYRIDGDAVEKLGKAGSRYELYRIVPPDATGAAVMTYGTFPVSYTHLNPDVEIIKKGIFFSEETLGEFDFDSYDYVADAIDSVTSKLLLAKVCCEKGIPEISSMGTGNKLDPERFTISDISKTSVCPLAKVMRRELKKRGIKKLQALWSDEEPIKPRPSEEKTEKRQTPGSIAFCPATAGLLISGKIIRDLAKKAVETPFLQDDGGETFI